MSWKDELQLRDLEPEQILEFTCKTCGHVHHYEAGVLQENRDRICVWLVEIEAAERCKSRGCNGRMRLAIYHDNANSGFVGGLA